MFLLLLNSEAADYFTLFPESIPFGIDVVSMLHWLLNGFILCFNDERISIDFIKLLNVHVDTIDNYQKLIHYSSEAHNITLLFYVIPG